MRQRPQRRELDATNRLFQASQHSRYAWTVVTFLFTNGLASQNGLDAGILLPLLNLSELPRSNNRRKPICPDDDRVPSALVAARPFAPCVSPRSARITTSLVVATRRSSALNALCMPSNIWARSARVAGSVAPEFCTASTISSGVGAASCSKTRRDHPPPTSCSSCTRCDPARKTGRPSTPAVTYHRRQRWPRPVRGC